MNLGLIGSAGLAGHHALGIHSPSRAATISKCSLAFFCVGSRDQTQVSGLHLPSPSFSYIVYLILVVSIPPWWFLCRYENARSPSQAMLPTGICFVLSCGAQSMQRRTHAWLWVQVLQTRRFGKTLLCIFSITEDHVCCMNTVQCCISGGALLLQLENNFD